MIKVLIAVVLLGSVVFGFNLLGRAAYQHSSWLVPPVLFVYSIVITVVDQVWFK